MELQKVFKKSYMEELRRNIHVSDYQGEAFPFDPSKVKSLANVYKPDGLLDRLDPEDDFTTPELNGSFGVDLKPNSDYHLQRIVVCVIGFAVISSYPKFSDN